MASTTDDYLPKFISLGMSEAKAKETLKNANVTKHLVAALNVTTPPIDTASLAPGVGMLLYHMASKLKNQIIEHLPLLVQLIVVDQKLDNTVRIDVALEYLLSQGHKKGEPINLAELEKTCGVGIVVTPDEIDRAVSAVIKSNEDAIKQQRYRFNVGKIMQDVRQQLPWADGKHVKSEIEVQIFKLLGEKTESDLAPPPKAEKKPKEKKEAAATPVSGGKTTKNSPATSSAAAATTLTNGKSTESGATSISELMKTKVHFHTPGENYKTDGYIVTDHTERLLAEHLRNTGGLVHTRFPPEPNGILHIGHAKAININFGYAAAYNGKCFLRYDDTNPEKEEEKFFVGIKDIVEWLGYKPTRITHSSDNFQQLYEWAVVLIRKGLAYICHQAAEDMKGFNPIPSPWRDRPIDESLQLFEDMKNGKIDEGQATLRMKITLEEGKMDPVAYRIKFTEHHRTKDQWCIYPTYDYTHCLCDSIENITHSLCTKEFQSRRSSYYWLCNALDIYCPVQWEYGRLNVNYTVVSKRKIGKLITEGIVADWDDPRLYTLTALRRRGYPAEAINNFCAQMGVTGAQVTIDPSMLDAFVRDHLNVTAPRAMVVVNPLKITLKNFPWDSVQSIKVPDFPNDPSRGEHTIQFDRVIYIDQSDFKENPEKGYRRLAPGQSVGLRYANYSIQLIETIKNDAGEPIELICSCEPIDGAATTKPKAFIQWVSQPLPIEIRIYESLFYHKNPEDINEVPGGFLSDCNRDSLKVSQSFVDVSMRSCKVFDKFQFERVGFFSVDPETTADKIIFNRTVTLKEDAGKL